MAVVRAHVTALGGNAMVSFYMSELILEDNPHKNQVNIQINDIVSLLIKILTFLGSNSDQRRRRCGICILFFRKRDRTLKIEFDWAIHFLNQK